MATTNSTTSGNTLGNGQWLLCGNSLWSNDHGTEFKMQGDGKIAIYYNGSCVWQNTKQQRNDIKGIIMQGDGNLCMYANDGSCTWMTDTAHQGPTTVCCVNNGGSVGLFKGTDVHSIHS